MKIVEYIKETRSEMKHVSWPTRRQTTAFTAIVIAISVFVAVLLGFFDYLFTLGIEKFILK
ncbi:MAG: preprotein translocase subunit SecE [Candidatus Paceibacterota bacterium]